jgi:hypothetical protein
MENKNPTPQHINTHYVVRREIPRRKPRQVSLFSDELKWTKVTEFTPLTLITSLPLQLEVKYYPFSVLAFFPRSRSMWKV